MTTRFRKVGDIERSVDLILEQYEEARKDQRLAALNQADELQAMADYLRRMAPLVRIVEDFQRRPRPLPMPLGEILDPLDGELGRLERELGAQLS